MGKWRKERKAKKESQELYKWINQYEEPKAESGHG